MPRTCCPPFTAASSSDDDEKQEARMHQELADAIANGHPARFGCHSDSDDSDRPMSHGEESRGEQLPRLEDLESLCTDVDVVSDELMMERSLTPDTADYEAEKEVAQRRVSNENRRMWRAKVLEQQKASKADA